MHNSYSQDRGAPFHLEPNDILDLGIVIVNYNTREFLRNCLRSIADVDRSVRFQICVVDNASTDGSAAMVAAEFPQIHLIENRANTGFSAGNNLGLRWFGFGRRDETESSARSPRYTLLLNPDTIVHPDTLAAMVAFMDDRPAAGVAGPRLRRPNGTLDKACRRSFPTPQVSFYRQIGLSKLFRNSRRFNAYNMEYLPEDAVHEVDSVVGAYMQLRREAIADAGLLDEAFFMYGEDLDWAKRIKDAGWQVWYNGKTTITHVKEAASSQSNKSRIDFYEAQWIFYRKHYRSQTNWLVDKFIMLGIVGKGTSDVARRLWRFCHTPDDTRHTGSLSASSGHHVQPPSLQADSDASL